MRRKKGKKMNDIRKKSKNNSGMKLRKDLKRKKRKEKEGKKKMN